MEASESTILDIGCGSAVRGRGADFTSLVLEIQMTFGGSGSSREILEPLVEADLLVLGCYGHSRLRETVFGGATTRILRDMTLPVLMAH